MTSTRDVSACGVHVNEGVEYFRHALRIDGARFDQSLKSKHIEDRLNDARLGRSRLDENSTHAW